MKIHQHLYIGGRWIKPHGKMSADVTNSADTIPTPGIDASVPMTYGSNAPNQRPEVEPSP